MDFGVSERPLSGKADTRTFEHVRELCESVLMGCDEYCVLQRASAGFYLIKNNKLLAKYRFSGDRGRKEAFGPESRLTLSISSGLRFHSLGAAARPISPLKNHCLSFAGR